MRWLSRLRERLRARPRRVEQPAEVDGIQLTATELERVLGIWTRLVADEGDESDERLEAVGRRVEKELQTYFGQDALEHAARGDCGGGGTILAADRLFVAFLGTRAAMAVSRKLYSNLQ